MAYHYFDKPEGEPITDLLLQMGKDQGYVPKTCLLGGIVVMAEVNAGKDPCAGCNGPREKCHGRPRKGQQ